MPDANIDSTCLSASSLSPPAILMAPSTPLLPRKFLLVAFKIADGMVHTWVGQKLLKSNVLRILFIVPN
jgi:hypothetical protein